MAGAGAGGSEVRAGAARNRSGSPAWTEAKKTSQAGQGAGDAGRERLVYWGIAGSLADMHRTLGD